MMKKKGMAKGGYRGGVKKMKKGGAAGGAEINVEELNPGKMVDVTAMATGGYMDDKAVSRMMGGGRPKGMAKGGAMGGVKKRSKGGSAGGLNAAIKRVKANK
tara:strand:- start:3694 stop:3999 length:306 start_codon:yes stop_codon:yes gene_type:complete